MPCASARSARVRSCPASTSRSATASGATAEQTSTRSVPSSAMTANLCSARRRLAAKRSGEVESRSRNGWYRSIERPRSAQRAPDLGGGEGGRDEVGLEDLDAVEPGRGGRVELVLQRAARCRRWPARCAPRWRRAVARRSRPGARTRTWRPRFSWSSASACPAGPPPGWAFRPVDVPRPATWTHIASGARGSRRPCVSTWQGMAMMGRVRWVLRAAPGRWVAGPGWAAGCARSTCPPGTAPAVGPPCSCCCTAATRTPRASSTRPASRPSPTGTASCSSRPNRPAATTRTAVGAGTRRATRNAAVASPPRWRAS